MALYSSCRVNISVCFVSELFVFVFMNVFVFVFMNVFVSVFAFVFVFMNIFVSVFALKSSYGH